MSLILAQHRVARWFRRHVQCGGPGWGARKGLSLPLAIICCLVILRLVVVPGAPVAALGCDDCREIKKELRDAALNKAAPVAGASPAAPVVRVVLYWAEGCGHCHEVLDSILPPMQEKYGPQLETRPVEVVSMEDIASFFDIAEGYGFARGRAAVPFLLIGDRALMGVEQIERDLPGLIETYLAAGGVDWPDLRAGNATPEPVATAGGICGVATPCESDSPAGSGTPTGGEVPAPNLPAPFLASMGLAAALGGSLAFILGRRAVRSRTRSAANSTGTSLPANGDNDAT